MTVRTDRPEAELRLFVDDDMLAEIVWPAHRQLAETIHAHIKKLLMDMNKNLHDLDGLVVYKGPGSFTGLRIGMSVMNALAEALAIPIVATQTDAWQQLGIQRLRDGERDAVALPEYGAPVRITQQKH